MVTQLEWEPRGQRGQDSALNTHRIALQNLLRLSRAQRRSFPLVFRRLNLRITWTRTLIGRVWGSRLRLRHVVVPLVSRRRRRLCHGFLLVHRRGRCVFPRWHSFIYGVQALGLGERGNFVIRREALESCTRWQKETEAEAECQNA